MTRLRLSAGGLLGPAATLTCAAVYFELYRQFWFQGVSGLTNSGKGNLPFLIVILGLAGAFMVLSARSRPAWLNTDAGAKFGLAVGLYLLMSVVVVALTEGSLDSIQRYVFFLISPMMVMLATVAIHPTNRSIKRTLWVLFVSAIILGIYSTILHVRFWSGEYLGDLYRASDPDIVYRESVPGLGGNQFPSMLVPLVVAGFFLSKHLTGLRRNVTTGATLFLLFNMMITGSRGAVLSLMAAALYLAVKRGIRINLHVGIAAVAMLVLFMINGDLLIERFASSILVQGLVPGAEGFDRWTSLTDSLGFYFLQHPFIGAGFTYFQDTQGPRIAQTDHNLYTQLLAQGGLLLVVPLLLVFGAIYRGGSRLLGHVQRTDQNSLLGLTLLCGFVSFLIDLNFPSGFFHYYGIWWGLTVAWVRNTQVATSRVHRSARPRRVLVPGVSPVAGLATAQPATRAATT